jgi:hypothetical protein
MHCTHTCIVSYRMEYKKEEYLHLFKVHQVVERVWLDWCDFIVVQITKIKKIHQNLKLWYSTNIVLCFVFLRLVTSLSGLSFFVCPFGNIQRLFRNFGHELTYFILSSTKKNPKWATQKRESSLRFSSLSIKYL